MSSFTDNNIELIVLFAASRDFIMTTKRATASMATDGGVIEPGNRDSNTTGIAWRSKLHINVLPQSVYCLLMKSKQT